MNQPTPQQIQKAEREITRAKIGLILEQPWFGTLVTKLVFEPGESIGVDTMETDGTRLFFNSEFTCKLTSAELKGVLAHEVLHCALLHPYRRQSRDMQGWNIAGDLVINDILVTSGFTLPKGGLIDPKYKGLTAEKAYAILPRDPNGKGGQGKVDPNGKNGIGGVMDAPPPDDNGKGKGQGKGQGKGNGKAQGKPQGNQPGQGQGGVQNRSASDWVIDVIQAEKVAAAAGKMPAGLGNELRKTRQCQTNYREVLKRFIDRTVAVDYSWSNPNRRLLGHGYVLPGIYKEGCGELLIGVDTSGSVPGWMLDQFAADIGDIIQTVRPSKVHVVYCDARVGVTEEFEPDGIPFVFSPKVARGGTNFQPVFNWAEANGVQPKACLYLTDLEPCDTPRDPGYPVLWCVPETCSTKTFAWGEVVEVQVDQKASR